MPARKILMSKYEGEVVDHVATNYLNLNIFLIFDSHGITWQSIMEPMSCSKTFKNLSTAAMRALCLLCGQISFKSFHGIIYVEFIRLIIKSLHLLRSYEPMLPNNGQY
jgi:hypothetical protein